MPSKTSSATRWRVLAISVVASAVCLGWLMRLRHRQESVELVAMSDGLRDLYEQRARTAPRPDLPRSDSSFPPALVREPIDEVTAALLFPEIGRNAIFDAALYYRRPSNMSLRRDLAEHPGGGFIRRTNSLGMREDSEPLATKPGWRILVTGASNVEGVCSNNESATNLLEALLAELTGGATVEALNTGVGAYDLYNDLAVLEHYRDLHPDVFVLVVYGGNDFFGCARVERYFDHRGAAKTEPHQNTGLEDLDAFTRGIAGTELSQVTYFLNNPEDVDIIVGTACSLTAEMERVCGAEGIRFVCAYLPPPLQGQPDVMAATRATVMERMQLSSADLEVSDRIADKWLAFLAGHGIAHVDLRPTFRASKERLYWKTDPHVNLLGHRKIADALLPLVEPGARRR